MSKKIAEGTHALVLDVKVGRGAFIKTVEQARELATTMVRLGTDHGVATVAQLTNMNAPLGRAIGNALEVSESVEVLQGRGPSDVRELTLALARIMVELVGIDVDPATKLDDGSGYEVYQRMIRAQGGDPDAPLPVAPCREEVVSTKDGYVQSVDALDVGIAAWRLGAGRARKEDAVSAAAGVECLVREGDAITKGHPMFVLHADDEAHLQLGRDAIAHAVVVGERRVNAEALLLERITN
jgi:thymidine phosphorylase